MTENRVSRRIRSGVMGDEVTKSYNCAHSDENNNYLGFGSSVLASGGVAHSLASVLAFNVSSDIKCIPNSLN
jgi:hypothetical protein